MALGVTFALFTIASVACPLAEAFVAAPTAARGGVALAAKKKVGGGFGASGGFGAAPPPKKPAKDVAAADGPALARPWDEADEGDGKQTRQQRRGGKGKIGAPQRPTARRKLRFTARRQEGRRRLGGAAAVGRDGRGRQAQVRIAREAT